MLHARRIGLFSWRVLRRFLGHHGLLLTSAVAFDTLLSVVPLLGLALVLVSFLVGPEHVRALAQSQLETMLPRSSEPIARAFTTFTAERAAASWIGVAGLLVFSAMAFRTLDNAIAIIFEAPRKRRRRRHALSSVLVPLAYVGLIVGGLLMATLLAIGLDMLPEEGIVLRGHSLGVSRASRLLFQIATFVATVGILASFYRVMPPVRVRFRDALVGGFAAATLWALVRRLLVWYFGSISPVGVIYGSLTTIVVLLLTLAAGALVVLLGAQAVAEVTRSAHAGMPWHQEPIEPGDDAEEPDAEATNDAVDPSR